MPEIIQKKINREARRFRVDKKDLAIAVTVIDYESKSQLFDAEVKRNDIAQPSSDLWSAALRVQEFINENYYPKGVLNPYVNNTNND